MAASDQGDHQAVDSGDTAGAAETGCRLSLVIPAYNEQERFPPYLRAIRSYCDEQFGNRYEVIVVDDGSRVPLADTLGKAIAGAAHFRILRHEENRGKGAAVRTGVLAAEGQSILFADADGATPIEEERRLRDVLDSGADVAVGSRILRSDTVRRDRHPLRKWIGRAFAAYARNRLRLSVSDPQCGFKMFRRQAARHLFSRMKEDGYYFDLEMFLLAERFGYRVGEAAINWEEKPGSRMSFLTALRRFFGALRRLRRLRRQPVGNSEEK